MCVFFLNSVCLGALCVWRTRFHIYILARNLLVAILTVQHSSYSHHSNLSHAENRNLSFSIRSERKATRRMTAQKRIHKNVWFYHSHSYYCYVNECYKPIERVLFFPKSNTLNLLIGKHRSVFEWKNKYNAVDLRLKNANQMTQSKRGLRSNFRWWLLMLDGLRSRW